MYTHLHDDGSGGDIFEVDEGGSGGGNKGEGDIGRSIYTYVWINMYIHEFYIRTYIHN